MKRPRSQELVIAGIVGYILISLSLRLIDWADSLGNKFASLAALFVIVWLAWELIRWLEKKDSEGE